MNGERKIRVLFVLLSLEIGGMEQVVADLIRSLDGESFEPIIACLESKGPIAVELEREGVRVMQLPRMVPIASFLYPTELVRSIREERADVVHVHSGCWHKAALAARIAGVKNVIYTEHGRIFPDSRTVMFLDRLYSPLTRHVVAVSKDLAQYMAREVGIAAGKISVIINGIDEGRFPSGKGDCTERPVRIGIIARLAPVKNIEMLLRAMAEVRTGKCEALLAVVGDGPERGRLEALATELGLGETVEFHGFRRDIPSVLRDIDIFALSSRSEGTSITLLEAMAAGKPVVVTNVGGNTDIVRDRVNGFVVPSGDATAMAKALLALVENPRLRLEMGAANVARVSERYSIRAMTRRYEDLYREATC